MPFDLTAISHVVVVFTGATAIGLVLGVAGSIALLRREALLGDSLAHCTLIGVVIAFLLTGSRDFGVLFLGASVSSALGFMCIKALQGVPVIKPDAALAVVLAGFFGFGLWGLREVQMSTLANKAGLEGFIFGKASLMTSADVSGVLWVTLFVVLMLVKYRRALAVMCFDAVGTLAMARQVQIARVIAAAILLCAVSVALPATGIILTCSLLVIPPTIAMFLSRSFTGYVLSSALWGALSGATGTIVSYYHAQLSTGASITLAAASFLLLVLIQRSRVWKYLFIRPTKASELG